MTVRNLYIKHRHGAPLTAVDTLRYDTKGFADNVPCATYRQALIASQSITAKLGLKPGDLRENIVIDFDSLYELASGTVIQIGSALLRLTFHCEPCKKILKLVDLKQILHRRGVFGTFLNSGAISTGDPVIVTDQTYEPIPYDVRQRIAWFLAKQKALAKPKDLVDAIGLPLSYARAIPTLLQKFSMAGSKIKASLLD